MLTCNRQFRNDKEFGYNALKAAHLAGLMNLPVPRNSLNFSDAMAVITPAFNAAFKPRVQERAWRNGGVYPFLRIPEALMKREELLAVKRGGGTGAAAATPAAELGMAGATALKWDQLMAASPVGNTFKATIPDDPDAYEITCARLGAESIFNCPPTRRVHLAMFFKEMRYMMALGVGDLKEFLAEAQAADASFAHVYANKEKAQLAYYEWAAARWNFTTQLSGLPAALKKEKEKQLREAAIARGEPVPDVAVKPAKKKIKLADFKAQADRLCPDSTTTTTITTTATTTTTSISKTTAT